MDEQNLKAIFETVLTQTDPVETQVFLTYADAELPNADAFSTAFGEDFIATSHVFLEIWRQTKPILATGADILTILAIVQTFRDRAEVKATKKALDDLKSLLESKLKED